LRHCASAATCPSPRRDVALALDVAARIGVDASVHQPGGESDHQHDDKDLDQREAARELMRFGDRACAVER
jgi:hypothetical protein